MAWQQIGDWQRTLFVTQRFAGIEARGLDCRIHPEKWAYTHRDFDGHDDTLDDRIWA